MSVKTYLSKYKRLAEILRQIDSEIAKLEAEIGSMGVSENAIRTGTVSSRTEQTALRLVEIKDRREWMKRQAWAKREEIENVILMCEDPVKGRLLYDRYILGMNWTQITMDLHYKDERHVRSRLHSAALQSVEKWVPEEELL